MENKARASDKEIAVWVVDTCLLFGANVSTAHTVAAMFVDGINRKKAEKSDGNS